MARVDVPITPSVLTWAIEESGFSIEEIADRIGVSTSVLNTWLSEDSEERPSLGQVRELAIILKRTPATLLLPAPPAIKPSPAKFRNRGGDRSSPNPEERRYLREAARLQRAASWVVSTLSREKPNLPGAQLTTTPEGAAADIRERFGADALHTDPEQTTAAQSFRAWRHVVEDAGVLVFLFPMGPESVAGFSLWDERAPVIAINTSMNHAARSFTLFHECGHLLTRTSSLCLETDGTRLGTPADAAERWCEEFAAAVLLPWDKVASVLSELGVRGRRQVDDPEVPKAIARRFGVSWRAATIRLIERGHAGWDLYRRIPPSADAKSRGGPTPNDDATRDRFTIRVDQYGNRTIELFIDALNRNVMSRTDVLDYLDVPDAALDRADG